MKGEKLLGERGAGNQQSNKAKEAESAADKRD